MKEEKRPVKLGDALRLGIVHLITESKMDSVELPKNLLASLAYMFLHRYINIKTRDSIIAMAALSEHDREYLSFVIHMIKREVFDKQKFPDLVELLNNDVLPNWCFKHRWDICNMNAEGDFASYVLDGNYLYCINHKDDNEPIFLRFNLDLVDPVVFRNTKMDFCEPGYGWSVINRCDYINKIYDPLDPTNNIDEIGVDELGYGYSKIYSFDYDNKIIILKKVNQEEDIYYGYDIRTGGFFRITHSEDLICRLTKAGSV